MARKRKIVRQINYWTIGGMEGEKPVLQAIEDAADLGYEGLELVFPLSDFDAKTPEKRIKEYKKAAKKAGITIESLCTGYYWEASLGAARESERKKAVAFTKDYLAAASAIGAKVALVIPGSVDVGWDPSRPVVPAETVWKQSTKSIRSLVPTAKKTRVSMGIENVWGKFLTGPFEYKAFIDQFGTSRVGAYFDIANCLVNGYPEHYIELLGKRLKAIHYKNFSRENAAGTLAGFGDDLLEGDVDFDAVRKALKKVKFSGPVTAEMIPFSRLPDLNLPDMKMARDTAKKLMKVTP